MKSPTRLKTLDLFSGIGGFSFGLRSFCHTIAYSEINPIAVAILKARMQGVRPLLETAPVFGDIQQIKVEQIPEPPDMITAGFPCQDISAANPSGQGLDGKRSGLFFEIIRLLQDLPSVRIVMLENSPFIRTRGLERALTALSDLGFVMTFKTYTPASLGAPQDRKRWFCLAVRNGPKKALSLRKRTLATWKALWEKEPCPRVLPLTTPTTHTEAFSRNKRLGDSVCPQVVLVAFLELLSLAQNRVLKLSPAHATVSRRLTLSDGCRKFNRKLWASPNASHWSQYHKLTERSTRVLANQVFYEVDTQACMKSRCNITTEKCSKFFTVNPNFIEWLMGFPKDYTQYT